MWSEALDACLSCGLLPGEVTGGSCTVSEDRHEFTLSLDCDLTPDRARALAESLLNTRPRVRELRLATPYGAWRWAQTVLDEDSRRIDRGVRFTVATAHLIPESADFWNACLAAFRIRITEQWAPRSPADELHLLDGLQAIRRRPGLFVREPDEPTELLEIVLEHCALGWLARTTGLIQVELSASGTVTVSDDGVPFSFEEMREGISWVHNAVGRLTTREQGRQWRRSDDRARRDFLDPAPQLAIVNALSGSFAVESSEGAHGHRLAYVRGRPLGPEQGPGWGPNRTRISFTPDPGLFDHPIDLSHARTAVERVASLFPGQVIVLNGERVSFDSLLSPTNPLLAGMAPWDGVLFEHTIQDGLMVLRCALGLSEGSTGHLECFLNLSRSDWPPTSPFRGDHVDAVLTAVADAVGIPGTRTAAREVDLVGIVSLELPSPRLEVGRSGTRVHLEPSEIGAIRKSLSAPLAVFLDSIPESRDTLAARWREAPHPDPLPAAQGEGEPG